MKYLFEPQDLSATLEGRQRMSVTVVDRGPHQISRSVEVHASASELFAIVADPTRHDEADGSGHGAREYSCSYEIYCGCAIFESNADVVERPIELPVLSPGLVPDKLIEWRHPALAVTIGAGSSKRCHRHAPVSPRRSTTATLVGSKTG